LGRTEESIDYVFDITVVIFDLLISKKSRAQTEGSAMAEVRSEKEAWAIIALLFFFMLINFADKAIIGLAGVPIMEELNLTPREFGLVGSSFFLLFSISAVITGFVVNRVQSKWVLLAMGLIWALVQFPMLGTVGIELLIACRIILGAGEGPAYPIALHAAYKWFPDERRAIPTAVISQGSAFGVVIAIPLLNAIITTYNWHYAFGALGIIGLVWVIAWAVLGKEGSIEDPATEGSAPYRDLLLNPTNIASWCAYFLSQANLRRYLSSLVSSSSPHGRAGCRGCAGGPRAALERDGRVDPPTPARCPQR
jgi:ACS family D-galactonate transporter-like MFS transporter